MKYPLFLTSPIDQSISFRFSRFPQDHCLEKAQRLNQFSVAWIQEGSGDLQAEFSTFPVTKNTLLFFEPEYPFSLKGETLSGIVMNVHPDFFYTIKQQSEVSCDNIIFSRDKRSSFIHINNKELPLFDNLFQQIELAIVTEAAGQFDLLVAYLKILIIQAARIKLKSHTHVTFSESLDITHQAKILRKLKKAIDEHYKKLHNPSEYAALLNASVKTLGRIVKTHCNKTITALIAERILLEARRELYLTEKPIKEIAFNLGFHDEYHFSKYFKNKASLSPLLYRNVLRHGEGNSQKQNIQPSPILLVTELGSQRANNLT
jgi:AraC-like DNA-binding protein